jgi:hypothetical protein
MAITKPPQFELPAQIGEAVEKMDSSMVDANAAIERVRFLGNKLLEEFAAIQDRIEELELYTEEEAAAILKIDERQLSTMRKEFNIPHCKFGRVCRYNKSQLAAICAMFEVNDENLGATRAA